MKKALLFDAVGKIDADILESYALMDQRLRSRQRGSKRKRYWVALLAATLAVFLVCAMLVSSLPLIYITNAEKINTAVSEMVEHVLFPLDHVPEGEEIKQEDLLINWVEWKVAEDFFAALGAGTDDSIIDNLQAMQSNGVLGESMQTLGDLLARMYDYYLKYRNEPPEDFGSFEFEIETSGNECTIVGVVWLKSTVIEIPMEYNGYRVIGIGEGAFSEIQELTEVILPISVKTIDERAFYGCESLRSVDMSGVIDIGASAFQNCGSLETVSMENVRNIGDYAFDHCSSLKSMDLKEIVSIGKHAFDSCKSLGSPNCGKNLKTLDDYAFANCEKITSFNFRDSIITLGIGTFSGCTSLNNVKYDCGSTVPDYTFDGCIGLQGLTSYDGLESIGAYAFRNCPVVLTAGVWEVAEIGEHCFDGCGETVIDLRTLRSDTIDAYAMANCYDLRSVSLPSHITKIEEYAFYNCPDLVEINFSGYKKDWKKIEFGENAIEPGTIIICIDGKTRYQPE